jgi:hypothetical protein
MSDPMRELPFEAAARAERRARALATARTLARSVAYWTPVWLPLVLLAQIAFLGLRPALNERRYLARKEAEMERRYAADLALRRELAAELAAHRDPIYRERVQRERREE